MPLSLNIDIAPSVTLWEKVSYDNAKFDLHNKNYFKLDATIGICAFQ